MGNENFNRCNLVTEEGIQELDGNLKGFPREIKFIENWDVLKEIIYNEKMIFMEFREN